MTRSRRPELPATPRCQTRGCKAPAAPQSHVCHPCAASGGVCGVIGCTRDAEPERNRCEPCRTGEPLFGLEGLTREEAWEHHPEFARWVSSSATPQLRSAPGPSTWGMRGYQLESMGGLCGIDRAPDETEDAFRERTMARMREPLPGLSRRRVTRPNTLITSAEMIRQISEGGGTIVVFCNDEESAAETREQFAALSNVRVRVRGPSPFQLSGWFSPPPDTEPMTFPEFIEHSTRAIENAYRRGNTGHMVTEELPPTDIGMDEMSQSEDIHHARSLEDLVGTVLGWGENGIEGDE